MMGVNTSAEVFAIVAEGDPFSGVIRELYDRVEWGIKSARQYFSNNGVVGLSREAKYIAVAGLLNPTVHYDGQGDVLRDNGGIVRFPFELTRQRIEHKRLWVENLFSC